MGAVEVVRGNEVLRSLPAQRLRCAILIYMAVTRETPRDRLLAMFWPERTEDRARHALSQNIYELRRVLGESWIEIRGERLIVSPDVSVDLLAFDEAAERSDHATVLGLYRGPFLDGFYAPSSQVFDSWVEQQRLRTNRAHRRARREWIAHLVSQARLREAVVSARDWVALDGLDDEGQHRLIELLAESGDRAGAIRQYEAYQKLLQAENLEPLPETIELVERVRGGDVGSLPATSGPPRPAATPVGRSERKSSGDADVAPPAAVPAAEPRPATAPSRVSAAAGASWRRLGLRVALAGVVFVALAGISMLVRARDAGRATALATAAPYQLAILYLDDNSPPPGEPHLAAGLTESLIDAFSRIGQQLTVRSKYSVAPFRDRNGSLTEIAEALRVDMILGGQVVATNDRVRVTLQLIDPTSTEVVLSETVERDRTELLALMDDLVDTAVWLLRSRLGRALDAARSRSATSADAWLTVQMALDLIGRTAGTGAERVTAIYDRADSLLAAAEDLDPYWLEPVIHRARLEERRAFRLQGAFDTAGSRNHLIRGIDHATRALQRQPALPAAHEARGILRYRLGNFAARDVAESRSLIDAAIEDLRTATSADPSRAEAFAQLATAYFSQGRFAEAAEAAAQADALDTFLRGAPDNFHTLGLARFEMGDDAGASAICSDGLRRFGHHAHFVHCLLTVMAWSDIEPARPDSAWALLRSLRQPRDSNAPSMRPLLEMLVAATILRAGQTDSALAVLDRAAARPSASRASGWVEAAVRARAGQTDRAASLLQQHFASSRSGELAVRRGRALRPILDDPAFRAEFPALLRDR